MMTDASVLALFFFYICLYFKNYCQYDNPRHQKQKQ